MKNCSINIDTKMVNIIKKLVYIIFHMAGLNRYFFVEEFNQISSLYVRGRDEICVVQEHLINHFKNNISFDE